jgi:hypothetical protein
LEDLDNLDVKTIDEKRAEKGLKPLPNGRGKFIPIPQHYLVI